MTLIDRLSKLDGPCPRTDVLIENELGLAQFKRVECGHGDSDYVRHNVQPYTASVDAAIVLAERVLPGWNANLEACSLPPMSDTYKAYLFNQNGDWRHCIGEGATPAIALCIAILRAKEASHGQ